MKIWKKDFIDIIQKFPDDYERFRMIKSNISYDNDGTHVLNSKCLICGQYSHSFNKCHSINYVPNREKIMNSFKKEDKNQERYYITTRTDDRFHARMGFSYVK